VLFQGRPSAWQAFRDKRLAVTLAGLLSVGASWLAVVEADAPAATQESITLNQLPQEAVETHRLIRQGGPFPFEKDGSVFANRERLLPAAKRGHYREYTVITRGAGDRGARRIVCGGDVPTRPEACYYTSDHYASFRRITQ
jgi:ribonuclease T1